MKTKKSKKNSLVGKLIRNKVALIFSAIIFVASAGYILINNFLVRPADIFVMESRPQADLVTTGLTNLEVNTMCSDDLWKKATYTCADGSTENAQLEICQSIESWQTYAGKKCEGKSMAVASPSATTKIEVSPSKPPERPATPSGVASESSSTATRPVGDCTKVCTKSIPARCTTTCVMKDGSTTTTGTSEYIKK